MKKIVSFVRINNNNNIYSELQKDGITKYVNDHNIVLTEEIEIEVNVPSEEENIANLLKNCNESCTVIIYDLNVFGRTTEGKQICVIDDSFKPYFYVIPKNDEVKAKLEKIVVEGEKHTAKVKDVEIVTKNFQGKERKVLKVYTTHPKDNSMDLH